MLYFDDLPCAVCDILFCFCFITVVRCTPASEAENSPDYHFVGALAYPCGYVMLLIIALTTTIFLLLAFQQGYGILANSSVTWEP